MQHSLDSQGFQVVEETGFYHASRLPYTALRKHVHGSVSISTARRCIARSFKQFD